MAIYPMRGDIAVAFAIGEGHFAEMGRHLTESLRAFTTDPEIYTFAPTTEWEALSDGTRTYYERHTTVATGDLPIAGYPVSAKLAAMEHAASATSRSHVLLLDTDTVVLDEIDCHDGSDDLYLKPADGAEQHWLSPDAKSDWQTAYDLLDIDYPGYTFEIPRTGVAVPPYWNAGFVLTSDHSFPAEWLAATDTIYGSELPATFFADQVALGALSTEYSVTEVDNRYNYPLPLRYQCPSDVRVLHYHDFQPCGRVVTPSVRRKLRSIGLTQSDSFPGLLKQCRLLAGVGLRVLNLR